MARGPNPTAIELIFQIPASKRTKAERALYREFLKDASARAKANIEQRKVKRQKAAKKAVKTRRQNAAQKRFADVKISPRYYTPLARLVERGVPINDAERYIVRLAKINNIKSKQKRYEAFYDWSEQLSEDYDFDWEYERDDFY